MNTDMRDTFSAGIWFTLFLTVVIVGGLVAMIADVAAWLEIKLRDAANALEARWDR
jgi:hypothetical protein